MSAIVELNRAEIVTICAVVSTESIMGVAPAQSSTERGTLLQGGEAALRQRQLAQSDHDGMLMIARDALALVATCAYPQRSLILHHVQPTGQVQQAFGQVHGDSVVFHQALSPELHQFQLFGSLVQLINHSLDWSGFSSTAQPNQRFHIQGEVLAEARRLVEQHEEQAALQALRNSGVAEEAALRFIGMLSQAPTTTIFNTVIYQAQQAISREYTVLQAGQQALLMTHTSIEQDLYQLETTNRDRLVNLLIQSLA